MATTSAILPPNLLNINRSKPTSCYHHSHQTTTIKLPTNPSSQPLISSLALSKQNHTKQTSFRASASASDAVTAAAEDAASSATEVLNATVPGDDGVSKIISALLFIAFVSLSILTIGVVYIGVTDFLQKREKEKFEKEEEAKMKKRSGKKKVGVRARGGPRGFGQKIDEDFDDL